MGLQGIIGLCALGVLTDSAAGQTGVVKQIQVPRLEAAIELDGHIDEPAWGRAGRIEDFHQIDPHEFGLPSERTVVRVFYDADFLYVAAELEDNEAEAITANQLRQRSGLLSDDRFWITLDTFHDSRNGYYFAGNPNGVGEDALIENNARMIWDWDGIWEVASARTERGWSLEFAIPFKTVAFDPGTQTWGINFGRIIERREEWIQWSSGGRQDFPEAPVWAGDGNGFHDLRQGLGLDVIPSLSLNGGDTGGREDLEPSLDLFYKPNPTHTLALTLNTDFAATEVDGRRVNLSRFSLFFPEKRDFFLQDAGIFTFSRVGNNGQPFFSRRIGISDDGVPLDIRAGLKLTGRTGRWNYGALVVRQDSAIGDHSADLAVARVSANVLEESSIGAILTEGDPDALADARTLGLDFRFRNTEVAGDQTLALDVFVQQAERNGIDRDNGSWGLDLYWPNDQHFSRLAIQEIEPHFDPALGFVNRHSIRFHQANYRYRIRPEDSRIRTWDHWIWTDITTDLDGHTQSRSHFYFTGARNQSGDAITYQFQAAREVLDEDFEIADGVVIAPGDYSWDTHWLFFDSNDARRWGIDGALASGGFYGGDRDHVRFGIDYRPSPRYTFEIDFNYNHIDLPEGRFVTRLGQLRTEVAFNPQWSWVTFVQYDNLSDTLGANSRLRWQPKVGQDVVLVVNYDAAVDEDYRLFDGRTGGTVRVSYTYRF